MAVPWTSPELATRYSRHVEELREFFAMQRLHYGTLEDIATLAARLDASGSFRDDLSSMVRVILLREGGSVPRADLLEIVIIAIAGADIDKAPQEVQQTVIHPPIQQIFAFLNGVLRKPWNDPPSEVCLQPEPILDDDAGLKSSPVAPGIPVSAESELPEEEDEPRDLLEEEPPPPTPDFVRPESILSRYTTLVAAMLVIATQTPAGTTSDPASVSGSSTVPEPNFAREPDPPSEPEATIADEISLQPEPLPVYVYASPAQICASKIVPWPKPIVEPRADPPNESQPNLALEQFPHPIANIFFPLPVPAAASVVAVESRSHPASSPPPSTLDPEPPSPSAFYLPHPRLGPLHVPLVGRIPADQIRIALISGIAASVFVAALMYSANRRSYSVMRAANQPAATPALKAAATSATDSPPVTAAPTTATTSPATAPPPHATRRRSRDDDYVAPPFSTPIQPELAAHPSTPRAPSPSAPATSSKATLASSQSNKADRLIETASSSAIQPRLLSVYSSEMAGNLLSAPAPGYPMLAKFAHLQGQVVVEAVVDRNGYVSRARVLSGHRLLHSAAVDEVLSRRYRPYLVQGHPVEVSTIITLDFPPSSTPSLPRETAAYEDLQAR